MTMFSKANTIQERSTLYFTIPSDWAKKNLYYLELYGHFTCDNKYRIEREPFNSYLLMLTLDGSGTISVPPSGDKHICRKNDLSIIDCNQAHCYYANNNWEFLWFHFNGNSSKEISRYIIEKYGHVTHIQETALSAYYIKSLTKKDFSSSINNEILISSYIHQVLADIISYEKDAQKNSRDYMLTNKAIAFIEKHYTDNISINRISEYLKVSQSSFCHIFKEETGFSPYDFIINKRLNRAKYLLKSTDAPIEEISYEVGFQSESNFIKTFKQKNQTTPGAFRKNTIL